MVAEIIDTAWEMKNAKEKMERQCKTGLEILQEALKEDCITGCDEMWYYCACETL